MIDELERIVEEKAQALVDAQKIDEVSLTPTNEAETKSYRERAKDFVDAVTTQRAVNDEGLQEALTGKRKEELLASADTELKKEAVKNKEVDIRLQEADYGVYMGVATYAGIKKPLPKKMQNILFAILCVIQTVFLIGFGVPVSIINIIADGVDSIVKKMAGLTRSAMWIVLVAIFIGCGFILYYLVQFLLSKIGIII